MLNNINGYKEVCGGCQNCFGRNKKSFISSEVTEKEIALRCKSLMERHGIDETWYYDCPALVLLGSRSCLLFPARIMFLLKKKSGMKILLR